MYIYYNMNIRVQFNVSVFDFGCVNFINILEVFFIVLIICLVLLDV